VLERIPEAIGHALIGQRAGMDNVVYNQLFHARPVERMELTSRAFAFNARIPTRFTADGEGISPPLEWTKVPSTARSLALLVEDADSPTPHPLVHAIVTGFEPPDGSLEEGSLGPSANLPERLSIGQNSFLQHAWLPPDPPRGHGPHRYVFQLFALGEGPAFAESVGRGALTEAILERAMAVGCLVGIYERTAPEASAGAGLFTASADPLGA